MTVEVLLRSNVRRALMWGGLLAILWVGVAILRPGTTFHLAPFLVAAAPPVLLTLDERSVSDIRSVVTVGAAGTLLSLTMALLLAGIGAMEGPAFEPFSTPIVEVIVFTAVGAAAGIGFGVIRSR